jgi:hypothetical protein
MTPDTIRVQLAAFLDSRAWRRDAKAAGLREAAALVRGLPDDDPLLDRLEKLVQATGPGRLRVPGDEADSGVNASRFRLSGLHDPAREFLERLGRRGGAGARRRAPGRAEPEHLTVALRNGAGSPAAPRP